MADSFDMAIVAAFKDKYSIVVEPGPDVARIRMAITGVASKPVASGVSSILPIGLAYSLVKNGATGSWSDPERRARNWKYSTRQPTSRLLPPWTNVLRGSLKGSPGGDKQRRPFKCWSEHIVAFIDNARGMK